MELTHQFSVPASLDETWEAFNDIGSIAGCFPGATLTSLEGDEFHGMVKIKFGPISMQYTGTAMFEERDREAGRLQIRAAGKDRRGQGTADAIVTAVLTEAAGSTRVDVHTELAITGKPAQFGGGMIEDVSERLLSQFVGALSDQLSESPGADSPVSVADDADSNDPASAAEPRQAAGSPSAARSGDANEINLASTVLPVLARRYSGHVVTAVLFLVVGWLLGRYTS